MSPGTDRVAVSDLARATYCPRQLYYARREDDRSPPPEVEAVRALAFRYPDHRAAADATLQELPIAVGPADYRENLARLAARDDWTALADPPAREVLLTGKDCRGIATKLLPGDGCGEGDASDAADGAVADEAADADADSDASNDADGDQAAARTDPSPSGDGSPPVPVYVAPGEPPEQGVWQPQSVRAVALAKALAWEREREIPRAVVEYPAVGVVRDVEVTVRRAARYRESLRAVRQLDGPPTRLNDDAKCDACDYRSECGVRSRSLRSLLGL